VSDVCKCTRWHKMSHLGNRWRLLDMLTCSCMVSVMCYPMVLWTWLFKVFIAYGSLKLKNDIFQWHVHPDFYEPQDVSFPKMYCRNCLSEWYRLPNFQGLAHWQHHSSSFKSHTSLTWNWHILSRQFLQVSKNCN